MSNQNGITFNQIRESFINISDELNNNRQYYNDLDSPLGDSDHGDSVCSSFKKVKQILEEYKSENQNIGELLISAGKAIVFSGGGAMGPLYGSAFMEAGKAIEGKSVISFSDLVKMWNAFLEAIEKRGGVRVGEKTMFDTIYPAVKALEKAHAEGKTMEEAFKDVDDAAKKGMESTKDMLALRGRSSRLGDRTIGHIDPGAASMYTVISTFFKTISNKD